LRSLLLPVRLLRVLVGDAQYLAPIAIEPPFTGARTRLSAGASFPKGMAFSTLWVGLLGRLLKKWGELGDGPPKGVNRLLGGTAGQVERAQRVIVGRR
jgi:hypothetical protein